MKTGRNEPCPCGSGRKYKKCCLAKDEAAAREAAEAYRQAQKREAAQCDDVLSGFVRKLEAFFDEAEGWDDLFPFGPEDGPLHALGDDLAASGAPETPDPRQLSEARRLAGPDSVLAALEAFDHARAMKLDALKDAYETLAVIMMETLARRASAGMGAPDPLGAIARMLDREIAAGMAPKRARDLYDGLRKRVRFSPAHGAGDAGLDRVRARIEALRAKTVAHGCTEEEAMAAAQKVSDLLDRYGLSLSETAIRGQSCEGIGLETGRKRRGAQDACIPTIAKFCDCRVWTEETREGEIRYIFFGLPADVAGAGYLYDVIVATFETETRAFKKGDLYASHPPGRRRTATASFETGLAHGVLTKLEALIAAREAARASSTGRDLIPVKHAVVDDEMEKLGLEFTRRDVSGRRRRVFRDAYDAGHEAGERFEWRAGLERGAA